MALVSHEDIKKVSHTKWSLNVHGYAVSTSGGHRTAEPMARVIMGLLPGDKRHVDHINHNKLDNRRENLRVCTRSQNFMNRKPYAWAAKRKNGSRFKGVSWHGQVSMWRARIKKDKKEKHIGLYETQEQAALAYNEEAKRTFGEYALLNEV